MIAVLACSLACLLALLAVLAVLALLALLAVLAVLALLALLACLLALLACMLALLIWGAIRHHNACPLAPFWLPGVALDLILHALDFILGMAWVPDWPGDLRMGWIAGRLEREQCFTRIQGSR